MIVAAVAFFVLAPIAVAIYLRRRADGVPDADETVYDTGYYQWVCPGCDIGLATVLDVDSVRVFECLNCKATWILP